jgi:predicted peptidase
MREEKRTFQHKDTRLNYLLYQPEAAAAATGEGDGWPFILFLHGAGERGDSLADLDRLKIYGIPRLAQRQESFQFIVAAPQCPTELYWPYLASTLHQLIDEVVENSPVDPNRIYITGLSMGGYGTWHLALNYPGDIAAAAPVCGGYIPGSDEVPPNICDMKDLPLWVFHGALDPVVSPRQSEVLVEALKACGSDVRFTLYPEAEHDSWTSAYRTPELYTWFLSHTRRR